MSARRIETLFPRLTPSNYQITSPETKEYNCFAWAIGVSDTIWDPIDYFWPENVPRELSIDALRSAYSKVGFTECENADFEIGFDKIAIYVNKNNEPSHAARLIREGRWTSKLGDLEDIEHLAEELAGQNGYGKVSFFMKRKNS